MDKLPMYLREFELIAWKLRPKKIQKSDVSDWQRLQNKVKLCSQCTLSTTRTQTVFGVGNINTTIMFIGEAPGFYEDQQGEPFVGRAGQLLNAMLSAINFKREDVYIANILKCRPPNNRDPLPEEVNLCTNYLNEQITLIKPSLLVALGRIAAHYLLKTKNSLESLRQTIHQYQAYNISLITTYHPAYLLRNPADKKKAYKDLLFIQGYLADLVHRRHCEPAVRSP